MRRECEERGETERQRDRETEKERKRGDRQTSRQIFRQRAGDVSLKM